MRKSPFTFRNNKLPESILSRYRMQKLGKVSEKYWEDEVGDYHGIQHEKYVYDFDGVDSILSLGSGLVISGEFEVNVVFRITTDPSDLAYLFTSGGILDSLFVLNSGLFMRLGGIQITTNIAVIVDEWQSLKITRGSDNVVKVYSNNLLTASSVKTADLKISQIGGLTSSNAYLEMELAKFTVSNGIDTLLNYNCEEQVGTIAFDSSGEKNHGAFVGGVTHTTAKVMPQPFLKSFYNFDGTDGYLESDDVLNGTVTDFDISFSMKTSDTDGFVLGSFKGATAQRSLFVGTYNGNFQIILNAIGQSWGNYTQNYDDANIVNSEWSNYRIVFDGTILNFYQNGILKTPDSTSGNIPSSIYDNSIPFSIGGRTGYTTNCMEMQLSDFVVKSGGVTLLHARLNEGHGTVAYDSSGNDNHLDFIGGITHVDIASTYSNEAYSAVTSLQGNAHYSCGTVTIGSNVTWEAEVDIVINKFVDYITPFGFGDFASGIGMFINYTADLRAFSKDQGGNFTRVVQDVINKLTKFTYGFNGTDLYVNVNGIRVSTLVPTTSQSNSRTGNLEINQQTLSRNGLNVKNVKFTINNVLVRHYQNIVPSATLIDLTGNENATATNGQGDLVIIPTSAENQSKDIFGEPLNFAAEVKKVLSVNHTNEFGYSNGVNMLKYSEDFTARIPGSGWYNQTVNGGNAALVTNDYANDPNGNNTAKRLQASFSNTGGDDISLVNQILTTYISNQQVVFSIWIKSNTASNQTVLIRVGNEPNTFTANQTWQKIESLSDGAQNVIVKIGLRRLIKASQTSLDILIWQPQLQAGLTSTPYQKTGVDSNIGVIIPCDEANITKDVLGNDLQFSGQVASDMELLNSNCIELDGTDGYATSIDLGVNKLVDEVEFFAYSATEITGSSSPKWVLGTYTQQNVPYRGLIFGNFGGALTGQVFSVGNDGRRTASNENISAGTHFYKVVWNNDITDYDIYIDGNKKSTINDRGTAIKLNVRKFWVGCRSAIENYFEGKIFGLKITSGAEVIEFPISEGNGTTSYQKENQAGDISWFGGATWATQDSFHHNINEGFNFAPYFDGLTSKVVFDSFDLRNATFRMKFIYNENAPEAQIISLYDNSNSARILNATMNVTLGGANNDFVIQLRDLSQNNLGSAAWNGLLTGEVYELVVKFDSTADDFVIKTLNGVTSTITTVISRGAGTQTADTFYLGIRIAGAFPFNGTIFSCEIVGLHKWEGINNWVDSIGNNNGIVTNPLTVKLPFKIGGKFTNPPCKGLNGAETELRQTVFREGLAASQLHFDASDLSSNVIGYEEIINSSSEVFIDEGLNNKSNVETFINFEHVTLSNRKEHGLRSNKNSKY